MQTAFLARFRREADAIAALDHVNIMPIYEYGEQEDLAYLVMPFVTGGTLRQILERRGTLPLNDALAIVEQIAAGLDYAHERGIIHRDLKPGNILLHADGRVLLTDFGIAKILNETAEASSEAVATLTGTGMVIGTPEYFSPEQATGSPVDRRTDVYSLGIMLYQMLGGRVPFTGTTPVAIAVKHTVEPPPPLSQLNPAISPRVEAVVMKALAKKPEQRYNSAGEFARALREAIAAPALPVRKEADNLAPVVLMSNDTIATSPAMAGPDQNASSEATTPVYYPPVQPVQRSHIVNTPVASIRERPEKRHSYLSVWTAIIGVALAIVLVVGGFFTYTSFIAGHQGGTASSTGSSHATATATKAANATSTAATTSPSPVVTATLPGLQQGIAAGALLYGTTQPVCDANSRLWQASSNAHIACTTSGLELTNTGTNYLAGVFLNSLPNNAAYPGNYVVQTQVIVNSASSGGFGVFFRNQPGASQGTFAFLIYPGQNRWEANYYNSKTGAATTLASYPTTMSIHGTLTIDVIVQGDTFQLYINGQKQGGAQSPTYPSGTIGLAADTGTTIVFKNVSLYAA